MPLPDDSTQQSLAAVSQAPESQYPSSKPATSATTRAKETTSGETSVQQTKPSTIESASSSSEVTHDNNKLSSEVCGILEEHNGMFTVQNPR